MFESLQSKFAIKVILFAGLFTFATSHAIAQETDTTEAEETCSALASELTHYAAIVDKNRLMNFKYAEHVSHQIRQWSLARLYQGSNSNKPIKLFAGTRGTFGLLASLERSIQEGEGDTAVTNTCEYKMADFAGIAGFQYSSNNFTSGLFGLYNVGGFDFKEEIENLVQKTDSDDAFGFGAFFAMETPFLPNSEIESTLLYTSFGYETSIGPDENNLRKNKGSIDVVRLNNYVTKYFISGASAFQLKLGTNLEYWTSGAIERTLNTSNTSGEPTPFNASENFSVLNVEPVVMASYSRAWSTPSGNSTELTLDAKLAYGLGSATSFYLDLDSEFVDSAATNQEVAVFKSSLIYGAGVNFKQSLGSSLSAEAGLSYDAMSGTQTASNELLLSLGLFASF